MALFRTPVSERVLCVRQNAARAETLPTSASCAATLSRLPHSKELALRRQVVSEMAFMFPKKTKGQLLSA